MVSSPANPPEHQLDLEGTCGLQTVLERSEPWLPTMMVLSTLPEVPDLMC